MAACSMGAVTHKRVKNQPGARVVEQPQMGLFVSFKSEHDSLWHYVCFTPDGRSHHAKGDTLRACQREVCDVLEIPRRRVIGGED